MNPKTAEILSIANAIAKELGTAFFNRLGPGRDKGNGSTKAFMNELHNRVSRDVESGLGELCICGNNKLCVDFYVKEEKTIIEIELSAGNPHTNFERDIFKGLLAKESGFEVDRLVVIGKPGTSKRLQRPDAKAITNWVRENHHIQIEVYELDT